MVYRYYFACQTDRKKRDKQEHFLNYSAVKGGLAGSGVQYSMICHGDHVPSISDLAKDFGRQVESAKERGHHKKDPAQVIQFMKDNGFDLSSEPGFARPKTEVLSSQATNGSSQGEQGESAEQGEQGGAPATAGMYVFSEDSDSDSYDLFA